MTKAIELSDKAYGKFKKLKRSNESFSDVVLRISGERKEGSLLRFAGAWKGDDIDEVYSIVMKDRKRSTNF